ncbi:MAG TPA: transglutaminase family protein [Opitutaceae bacterium]|nr:transglutaminase family protein [Opitutaceae bacterium]
MAPSAPRPEFDLTVRVGCSLAYEVTGTASLLLNVRPRPDRHHAVLAEALTLGDHLPAEEFTDSHGNSFHRVTLSPGSNLFRHDAIVAVSSKPDNHDLDNAAPLSPGELPPAMLRYTLPSRYCDSDKLVNFAWEKFGKVENGWPRVQAISRWLHDNIEYRYLSGRGDISAWDVLQRGYGVCRDFAHLAIALNRTFNVPTRYVTGHLPDIGFPDPDGHMDFHAYAEVYLGGRWFTTDARFHVPRIGRITVSCGLDAVDGAFSTIYGGATLTYFQVWAYQVARGSVGVGDPLDLSVRLDNQWAVQMDPAG